MENFSYFPIFSGELPLNKHYEKGEQETIFLLQVMGWIKKITANHTVWDSYCNKLDMDMDMDMELAWTWGYHDN